jgi:hypothetical protein
MAYIWARPIASPEGSPWIANWATNNGNGFIHPQAYFPEQYQAEAPCPLYVGCAMRDGWRALDPCNSEYKGDDPLSASWPPPQPPAEYDAWLAAQRKWIPYEYIAYNGVESSTPCSSVLGVPNAANTAQWLKFDFPGSADWKFAANWTGIRVVALCSRHHFVTNDGSCDQKGPVRLRVGVYKHTAAYPAYPTTWDASKFSSVEVEFSTYGVSWYRNPYGMGVATAVFDITTPPDGPWTIADEARYWVIFGQTKSTQGSGNGNNNGIIGLSKIWAGAIADLTGSPGSSSPDTIHSQVVG